MSLRAREQKSATAPLYVRCDTDACASDVSMFCMLTFGAAADGAVIQLKSYSTDNKSHWIPY